MTAAERLIADTLEWEAALTLGERLAIQDEIEREAEADRLMEKALQRGQQARKRANEGGPRGEF